MRAKGTLVSLTIGSEVYEAKGTFDLKPASESRQLHSQRITVDLEPMRASQEAINAMLEFGRWCQWLQMWKIAAAR